MFFLKKLKHFFRFRFLLFLLRRTIGFLVLIGDTGGMVMVRVMFRVVMGIVGFLGFLEAEDVVVMVVFIIRSYEFIFVCRGYE